MHGHQIRGRLSLGFLRLSSEVYTVSLTSPSALTSRLHMCTAESLYLNLKYLAAQIIQPQSLHSI